MSTTEDTNQLNDEEQAIIQAVYKAQMEAIEKYLEELISAMKQGKLLALTVSDLEAMLAELRKRG
jgi:hypothetical protein